jgi:hypothetical protein
LPKWSDFSRQTPTEMGATYRCRGLKPFNLR